MSLVINMTGGAGGFSAGDAILRVLAPAGSTVTVSKSSTSKTLVAFAMSGAQDTNCYYYIVKPSMFDSSPWTVTAVDGSDTDSDTIVINASGEYTVSFAYWDGEIYDAGNEYDAVTGGFESFAPAFVSGYSASYCVKNADNLQVVFTTPAQSWNNGAFCTANVIDITGYTTLHLTATKADNTSTAGNSHFKTFGIRASKVISQNIDYYDSTTAEPNATIQVGENTLSIVGADNGYIWFGGSVRDAGSNDIIVTKIWLT